jgi:hypothetical protein
LSQYGRQGNGVDVGLKIGRTLELTRKERGLSLHQVEQETKIRARYLRELERENFDVLPPVYVQGSLKTYANFLGLDGEVLTQELRRRRPPQDEPEAPAHVEPQKGDPDRTEILLGGAAGAGTWEIAEDEEDAAASVPVGDNNRLYLVSGAFLVLVAIALVLTLARDSQPEVSQVREPLISQAPSAVSRAGGEESERAYPQSQEGDDQSSGDGSDGSQPSQDAGVPDAGDQGGDLTGQTGQAHLSPTQDPPDETADLPSPAATDSAPAEPETTPTPPATEPAANTAPPSSTPAEAPIQDGVTGVGADDSASQDDEVLVTRTSLKVSSQDGDSVEIRRGKGGLKIRATEDRADDEDNDR